MALDTLQRMYSAYIDKPMEPEHAQWAAVDGLRAVPPEARSEARFLAAIARESADMRLDRPSALTLLRLARVALLTRSALLGWRDAPGRAEALDIELVCDEEFYREGGPHEQAAREELERTAVRIGRATLAAARFAGASAAAVRVRNQTFEVCLGGNAGVVEEYDDVLHAHHVLVLGESGSGKEIIATAIRSSARVQRERDKEGMRWVSAPTESVNLAGIPRDLLYGELFGHEARAFTGASDKRRPGLFERVNGGVAFLDEIAELTPEAQASLLRVIETGLVRPLGGTEVSGRARVVGATHADLRSRCAAGEFRWDLFARLAGTVIEVPPLRIRREDVPVIARAIVGALPAGPQLLETAQQRVDEFLDRPDVRGHSWPGNVRELAQAVRACALDIAPELWPETTSAAPHPDGLLTAELSMEEVRSWYARQALDVHGTILEASRKIGVGRNTVAKLLRVTS